MSHHMETENQSSSKWIPISVGLLAVCWVTTFMMKDKKEAAAKPAKPAVTVEMQRPKQVPGAEAPRLRNEYADMPKAGYVNPRGKKAEPDLVEDPFADQPESMTEVSLNRSVEAQIAYRKTASNPPPDLRKLLKEPAKGWKKEKAKPIQLPQEAMLALREMDETDHLQAVMDQQIANLREAFYNQGATYEGPSLKEIEEMEKKKNVVSF
ncbi:MAG: hypothetical protein ACI9TH_001809 [Kiritimatiellia bacterium]|jgi:hypothetical protein